MSFPCVVELCDAGGGADDHRSDSWGRIGGSVLHGNGIRRVGDYFLYGDLYGRRDGDGRVESNHGVRADGQYNVYGDGDQYLRGQRGFQCVESCDAIVAVDAGAFDAGVAFDWGGGFVVVESAAVGERRLNMLEPVPVWSKKSQPD